MVGQNPYTNDIGVHFDPKWPYDAHLIKTWFRQMKRIFFGVDRILLDLLHILPNFLAIHKLLIRNINFKNHYYLQWKGGMKS